MRALVALFRRSPFGALQEHMEKAVESAEGVVGLLDALCAGDVEALSAARSRVVALETEADNLKNRLRNELPRRRLGSIDRRDLLEILDLQDSIADAAEDIADLAVLRPWSVPEDIVEPLGRFTRRSVDAALAGRDVVRNLEVLAQRGLAGPDTDVLLSHIEAVNALEDESDELQLEVLAVLMGHEGELSALDIVLWMRLLDGVGDLADYPKKVCNRLRLVVTA